MNIKDKVKTLEFITLLELSKLGYCHLVYCTIDEDMVTVEQANQTAREELAATSC